MTESATLAALLVAPPIRNTQVNGETTILTCIKYALFAHLQSLDPRVTTGAIVQLEKMIPARIDGIRPDVNGSGSLT